MELEGRQVVCRVCCTQFSRYICPRCNLAYCSLACYKQHGVSCTEAFARDQAVAQLQGSRADTASRRQMLAVLRRTAAEQQQQEEQQEEQQQQQGGHTLSPSSHLPQAGPPWDPYTSSSSSSSSSSRGNGQHDADHDDVNSSSSSSSSSDSDSSRGAVGGRAGGAAAGRLNARRQGLSKETWRLLTQKAQAQQGGGGLTVSPEDLSPADLRRFHRALAAGQLSHLLPPWQPWWTGPEAHTCRLTRSGQAVLQPLQPPQPPQPPGQLAAQPATEASDQTCQAGVEAEGEGEGEGEEGEGEGEEGRGPVCRLPAPPDTPLPSLASLTHSPPSPLLRWQLLQLLFSYCWVQRTYNGEPSGPDTAEEAGQAVLALCPGLVAAGGAQGGALHGPGQAGVKGGGEGGVQGGAGGGVGGEAAVAGGGAPPGVGAAGGAAGLPASVSAALLDCLVRCCQPPVGGSHSRPQAVAILHDCGAILQAGGSAVLLALTDLRRLLQRAQQQLASTQQAGESRVSLHGQPPANCPTRLSHGAQAGRRALRQQLWQAAHKLWFFMVWVNDTRCSGQWGGGGDEGGGREGQGLHGECIDLMRHVLAPAVHEEWRLHLGSLQQATPPPGLPSHTPSLIHTLSSA